MFNDSVLILLLRWLPFNRNQILPLTTNTLRLVVSGLLDVVMREDPIDRLKAMLWLDLVSEAMSGLALLLPLKERLKLKLLMRLSMDDTS